MVINHRNKEKPEYRYGYRSELLVVDLNGEVIDTIAECRALYSKPQFSPDGQRLVYFKYLDPQLKDPDLGDRLRWDWVTYYGLFEHSLGRERVETMALDMGFNVGLWVRYYPEGQGLLAFASRPSGWRLQEDGQRNYLYHVFNDGVTSAFTDDDIDLIKSINSAYLGTEYRPFLPIFQVRDGRILPHWPTQELLAGPGRFFFKPGLGDGLVVIDAENREPVIAKRVFALDMETGLQTDLFPQTDAPPTPSAMSGDYCVYTEHLIHDRQAILQITDRCHDRSYRYTYEDIRYSPAKTIDREYNHDCQLPNHRR